MDNFTHPSLNPLTPNDPYSGRTAPLTSKRCILYIYSTNIGTEYFKHGIYSPFFFSLQNAVCFIIVMCLVPVLLTFYIQDVLKLKNKSGAKRLIYNARNFGTVLWTIWLGYKHHDRRVRFPTRPKTFLFAVAARNLRDPCYVGPFRKGEAPKP